MNNYLISVDIEGITGVVNKTFSKENGEKYKLACKYMLSDVNAVIQGIVNIDSDAQIIVRDAHGNNATNLDLEQLHPSAKLIQGWNATQNMLTGLTSDFMGVFFVGYHAGGNNVNAVLGHTMHSIIHTIKVNNKLLNETGLFALYAGNLNIPVVFISGDNHAIIEAKEQLGEEIVCVVVKESYGRACASSLSLKQAKSVLEINASIAVKKLQQKKFFPFKLNKPLCLEMKFYDSGVRISLIQNLFEILNFDKKYNFSILNKTLKFKVNTVTEMIQRLNVILQLIYGMQS